MLAPKLPLTSILLGVFALFAAPGLLPGEASVTYAQDDDDESESDDDDDEGDLDDVDEEEEDPVDPEVAKAVKELVTVHHTLNSKNEISLVYGLDEQSELEDFPLNKGFDKSEVLNVYGSGGRQEVGLELGAGSRRMGQLRHGLPLTGAGAFEIEIESWAAYNSPSAVMCVLLSKKVGVSFGQTIVKPGKMRPYNKKMRPDLTVYREERTVKMNISWDGQSVLTVKCNGRLSDKRTFKKGELKNVQLGFAVRNMRLVISTITIKGEIDLSKL